MPGTTQRGPYPRKAQFLQNQWNLLMNQFNTALVSGAIGNGTTAGRLRTNAAITHRINGTLYTKASTDDLWNLSAQAATAALKYRAFWLYLSTAGAASIVAQDGADSDSAADAILALPQPSDSLSVIGVYVAGPSTVFTNALAAQGTIYDGFPASLSPARVGTLQ